MKQFVLDVVHRHRHLFAPFYKPLIVLSDAWIETNGSQCSLCQHSFYMPVGHVVHMWILMHAGARVLAECSNAIVAGYTPCVIVEPAEIVSIYHQANSILNPGTGHKDCKQSVLAIN